MDVTRSNFKEVLLELDDVIRESSFVAVDGEFTGLMEGRDVGPYNTIPEYYGILRDGAMRFLFIQFGLCAFKYNAEKKKWTHTAYNFYVFPKPSNRQSTDNRFLCQSSSIDFLASNDFDFNKLFREGIPYLPASEEEKQRAYLTDKHAKEIAQPVSTPTKESESIPIPDEHAGFVQDVCARIESFITTSDAELELPRCNAFVRKLLYQTVEDRYATQVRLESRLVDNNRVLIVANLESEEEKQKRLTERREKELSDFEDAVGFSKVVRLLISSRKMLVGHNMMLDLCHILDQFCSPIPQDYMDFKAMLHEAFPSLLDTKYVSGCSPFKEIIKSNMLSDLHLRLTEEPYRMPVIEPAMEGRGYAPGAEKYHEAGYDAYITGMCLIAMANHLDAKSLHPDIATLPLLRPYMNKILLTRIQDFGYMSLAGKDPVLPRDHVFHVSFPKEWKQVDIVNLFSAISGVYVSWIDSTSAYVALFEREKCRSVMKLLRPPLDVTVTPYLKLRPLTAVPAVPAVPASPTTLKRLQEADRTPEITLKRKKTNQTFREAKFSRRSIDTIPEDEEKEEEEDEGYSLDAQDGGRFHGNDKHQFEEDNVW